MKKLFITALVIGATGFTYAQGNQSTLDQSGTDHGAMIMQVGQQNKSDVDQVGIENTADVYQEGKKNMARINQAFSYNEAFQMQYGNGNDARISQNIGALGGVNYADQYQDGNNNEAIIEQGFRWTAYNSAVQTQEGGMAIWLMRIKEMNLMFLNRRRCMVIKTMRTYIKI